MYGVTAAHLAAHLAASVAGNTAERQLNLQMQRLLSTALKVKEMYCINVKKVGGGERKVLTEILEDLAGKKLLLVEDMLETGRSLAVAKAHLEAKGATVQTACLYTMPHTEVPVDYSVKQVTEVIPFPWE
eukprot:gene25628-11362_t